MPGAFVSLGVVRHVADGLTASKYEVLAELAANWQRARNAYIKAYWEPSQLSAALGSRLRAREIQRKQGWAPIEISIAHHQTAFLSALAAVRCAWASRLALIEREIWRDRRLTLEEKRWAHWVLRHPEKLQTCINGGVPDGGTVAVDPTRCSRNLRGRVLRHRGHAPRAERRRWFEIDKRLYRTFSRADDRSFRGSWLALGVGTGRRLCVPLAGSAPLFDHSGDMRPGSNIRIFVERRISIHYRMRAGARPAQGLREIGLDKGYRTLLTASDGNTASARSYGSNIAATIARIAEGEVARLRERRRIAAFERSIRNSDADTARRIRRRNLGQRAIRARSRRQRAQLRGDIGSALNDLFAGEPGLARIHAERLDLRSTRLSRRMHQRLGRWAWGYLQKRLSERAELNGVELNVVNAAYTSQTCPSCGFTSKRNRQKGRFECRSCGYTGSSDAVAATNVLARGSDPAITRFTPVPVVKQILDERWRSARNGRAWGLSVGNATDERRSAVGDTDDSREQPGSDPVHQGSANPSPWNASFPADRLA